MKKIACLASLFLMSSAIAFASSAIDGGWTGEIGTGDAKQTIQMMLKVDGTKLSGSVIGGTIEMSIQDGTFDGSKLQFKAVNRSADEAEGETVVSCSGAYASDVITLACTTQGDTRFVNLNRAP